MFRGLGWFILIVLILVTAPVSARPRPPLIIAAVGDLMIVDYGRGFLGRVEAVHPFAKIKEVLAAADIVVGNLEAPLTDAGEPTLFKSTEAVEAGRDYVFRTPTRFAAGLAATGFTLVTLANNHLMDYREEGLQSTLEALAHSGVSYAGAGRTETEARSPHVVSRNGWKVGFLAYSDINPVNYWAVRGRPGIASSMDAFRAKMAREIGGLRRQVDFLAVSVHWGEEYHHEPNERQRELARFFVDHGADLVIGHHPHVLQRTEVYRDRLILYSLGNFVSFSASGASRLSAVALIDARSAADYWLIPVLIEDGQPRPTWEDGVSGQVRRYLRPIGGGKEQENAP